jgi:hypothetical protein
MDDFKSKTSKCTDHLSLSCISRKCHIVSFESFKKDNPANTETFFISKVFDLNPFNFSERERLYPNEIFDYFSIDFDDLVRQGLENDDWEIQTFWEEKELQRLVDEHSSKLVSNGGRKKNEDIDSRPAKRRKIQKSEASIRTNNQEDDEQGSESDSQGEDEEEYMQVSVSIRVLLIRSKLATGRRLFRRIQQR